MDTMLVEPLPGVLVDDRAARLLTEVVAALGPGAAGDDPEVRLAAVGRLLSGTAWRSYRAGRVRLIGLVGSYWMWFRPKDAVFSSAPGLPVVWATGGGVFAELFVCDADPADPVLADHAAELAAAGGEAVDGFVGVRVVSMTAPHRSLLVPPAGHPVPLAGTAFGSSGQVGGV
jgi:hypothetical protein